MGQPLKLTAKTSGHPEPDEGRMKDGRPIRSGSHTILSVLLDGTVSLEIDSAKPEDAGRYTLTVSNELGETTGESSVEIVPPSSSPQFVIPLAPAKATDGFRILMKAKVSGYPAAEISWMKDGKKFKSDKGRTSASKKVDPDGMVQLELDPACMDDTGRNPEGECQSSAPLTVRLRQLDGPEEAPMILSNPGDQSVDDGHLIQLSAVIGGNPVPDVQWTRNGEPVPTDHGKLCLDGDKLTVEIAKALKSDEGDYQLTLANPSGVESAKARVNVRKIFNPPTFSQKFSDVQQLPTYDAKFLARVTGNPKPTVGWTFNGEPIHESDKYKIKRDGDVCALFVRDCAPERAGRYACVASNSEGNSTVTIVFG